MSEGLKAKSEAHLKKLQEVYKKNPELINEFVSALKFECDICDADGCDECIYDCPDHPVQNCIVFCESGIERLNMLMAQVRGDV